MRTNHPVQALAVTRSFTVTINQTHEINLADYTPAEADMIQRSLAGEDNDEIDTRDIDTLILERSTELPEEWSWISSPTYALTKTDRQD